MPNLPGRSLAACVRALSVLALTAIPATNARAAALINCPLSASGDGLARGFHVEN